ncbi:group II intron reverse transcriptase/maturase [Mesotoga sp. TolDC]|uniref:group II intron reverse transcriptase/maturase n=1 Tax=Mesotoga sp. TolDC TaxID=1389250 RepID=UPI000DA6453A|nr:group II intron reverse transcriptase/maturase [Mesotoga sp. TolDC]PZC53136.1 DNA polymerase [Mesotoga sp. TolDC]
MRSYEIPKKVVLEAFKKVKENRGAEGIDEVSLEEFEADLDNNLYKIWNRMTSGSYFPPPVKAIEIEKKGGGKRVLGIPTVGDRVAQMVAKIYLNPLVDPHFHKDSYGYREGKSAIDALEVTRQRCWRYDWVLEYDIKGLFDNIDHELLMRAVKKHVKIPWLILYIERWLKAPFMRPNGRVEERSKGTPQGGVISPVLANLFMHYAFDKWMERTHPDKPFARYADDGVIHCRTLEEARLLLESLKERMEECKLELHPEKTRIVYCKDDKRKEEYPNTSFDFLGYTFRVRSCKDRNGRIFYSFNPAVSEQAKKAMRQKIRRMRLQTKSYLSIEELSERINPVIRGWINYYGHFRRFEMYTVLSHVNKALVQWVRNKYKKRRGLTKAGKWLEAIARREPHLFVHWTMGIFYMAG